MGIAEYGEVFAFDDGAMPRHDYPQPPRKHLPFYGFADVTPLELSAPSREEDILEICRAKCRSDYFVLIDHYKDVADTFMLDAAMCAESGLDSVEGYRIFQNAPLRGRLRCVGVSTMCFQRPDRIRVGPDYGAGPSEASEEDVHTS